MTSFKDRASQFFVFWWMAKAYFVNFLRFWLYIVRKTLILRNNALYECVCVCAFVRTFAWVNEYYALNIDILDTASSHNARHSTSQQLKFHSSSFKRTNWEWEMGVVSSLFDYKIRIHFIFIHIYFSSFCFSILTWNDTCKTSVMLLMCAGYVIQRRPQQQREQYTKNGTPMLN